MAEQHPPAVRNHGNRRDGPDGPERRCGRCVEWWPDDTDFFYRHRDGAHSWCIACSKDARRRPRQPSNANPPTIGAMPWPPLPLTPSPNASAI